MKKMVLLTLCLLFVILLTGCIRTSTYQVDREDQDLRGNRGVVMGDVPPPEIGRKRTRTMARFDVELPPSKEYKAKEITLEKEPVRERPVIEEEIVEEPVARRTPVPVEKFVPKKKTERLYAPLPEKTYTVKEGDTLQKISKNVYGTTRRWPEIYEANKDTIKDPSNIYPGQVITIPLLLEPVNKDEGEVFGPEEDIK